MFLCFVGALPRVRPFVLIHQFSKPENTSDGVGQIVCRLILSITKDPRALPRVLR